MASDDASSSSQQQNHMPHSAAATGAAPQQNGTASDVESRRAPPRHSSSTGPSADPRKLQRVEQQVKETIASHGGPEQRQTWTFSSSGWLFCFHFGVIKCLRDLNLNENIRVIGSSGGACAGSFLFLPDADIDGCVEYIKECAVKARSSWRSALKISEFVKGAVDRFQPPDAAKYLEGNMEVSVSKLQWPWMHWPPMPLKNVRVKHFPSNDEMEKAIIASACIVPAPPIQLQNIGTCIDGVYSDSQLVSSILFGRSFFTLHLEDAISVCPFYSSRADIVPSKYVNPTWAAYPPEPEKLGELYELGYKDALAWLLRNGKIPYGVAHADASMEDTADSNRNVVPAWRQTLNSALETVQAQMSEGAAMLRDGAQAAVGCDAATADFATEAVTYAQAAVSLLAWALIVWEMFVHSCIAATVAAWAPLLPVSTAQSWRRFTSVSRSMRSPRLFLKTVPVLSSHVELSKSPEFAKDLREHSVLYRLFQYVLL